MYVADVTGGGSAAAAGRRPRRTPGIRSTGRPTTEAAGVEVRLDRARATCTSPTSPPARSRRSMPASRKVGIRSAQFAPDGRGVYVVSDEDGEFAQLQLPGSRHARGAQASPRDLHWDIEDFDVSADGRYIAYVVNEDGRSRLTVARHPAQDRARARRAPRGPDRRLALRPRRAPAGHVGRVAPHAPRDVYVYDLEHSTLERWTQQRDRAARCQARWWRPSWCASRPGTAWAATRACSPPTCTGRAARPAARWSSTSTADRSRSSARAGIRSSSSW